MVNSIKNVAYVQRRPLKEESWLKPVDSLFLFYQVVISGVVAMGNLPNDLKLRLLGYHGLFFLALVVGLWNIRNFTGAVPNFLREFYPLIAVIFLYREVGLLVHAYFEWNLDDWLLNVDDGLGRIGLSVWNFQRFYPPRAC